MELSTPAGTRERAPARGTRRAGKGESQISQAQSRLKMGTVPSIGIEEGRAGNSFAGNEGKANRRMDAANACHSLCEEEGGTTGAAGAEGEGVATQQAGVGQVVESHPVRQQPDFPMRLLPSGRALAVMRPCPARNSPSRNAITVFAYSEFIALGRSFRNPEPYAAWQIHCIEERVSIIESQFWFTDAFWRAQLQFFSVPHVSIALPM